MKQLFTRFIRNDEGQDLIEYALLGGIIVAVTATAIGKIGTQTKTLIQDLCTAIGTSC
jgi:Flp pilus assembly pilin Flp